MRYRIPNKSKTNKFYESGCMEFLHNFKEDIEIVIYPDTDIFKETLELLLLFKKNIFKSTIKKIEEVKKNRYYDRGIKIYLKYSKRKSSRFLYVAMHSIRALESSSTVESILEITEKYPEHDLFKIIQVVIDFHCDYPIWSFLPNGYPVSLEEFNVLTKLNFEHFHIPISHLLFIKRTNMNGYYEIKKRGRLSNEIIPFYEFIINREWKIVKENINSNVLVNKSNAVVYGEYDFRIRNIRTKNRMHLGEYLELKLKELYALQKN